MIAQKKKKKKKEALQREDPSGLKASKPPLWNKQIQEE